MHDSNIFKIPTTLWNKSDLQNLGIRDFYDLGSRNLGIYSAPQSFLKNQPLGIELTLNKPREIIDPP